MKEIRYNDELKFGLTEETSYDNTNNRYDIKPSDSLKRKYKNSKVYYSEEQIKNRLGRK